MALTQMDRARIRELKHAARETAALRGEEPALDEVMRAALEVAEALYRAAMDVVLEEADDPHPRAERDRAAEALREGAVQALVRFRGQAIVAGTDPDGRVVDRGAIETAEDLVRRLLPDAGLGGLPEGGPALHAEARAVRDALRAHPHGDPGGTLAQRLDTLLAAFESAMDRVATEARELTDRRASLNAARDEAARVRRAAWHLLQYLSTWRGLSLDLGRIFPVSDAVARRGPAEVDAALDAVGAPRVDEPAPAPVP